MYLLDTNICVYILNNAPVCVFEKVKEFDEKDIHISSISVAELYYGASKSKQKEMNLIRISKFLQMYNIIDFGEKEAKIYGDLFYDLEKNRQKIGYMDTLIAATALANNLTIVTNNEKEFVRVPNLKIENWAK